MSRRASHIRLCLLLAGLAIFISGCGAALKVTTAPPGTPGATRAAPAAPTVTIIVHAFSTVPSITAIATPSAASIAQPVTVQAVSGNLFIRRGPNTAFNPLAVLVKGHSARAMARDVLGEWVQIPLPGNGEQTGWISIQTRFSSVSGDVKSLSEIEPAYWPVPAFLRNCTYHELVADPGGIQIPPVDSFPENDVRVDPGSYAVHDSDVDGYPEVLRVDLKEGSAIDIRVDGNGDKKKCPVP